MAIPYRSLLPSTQTSPSGFRSTKVPQVNIRGRIILRQSHPRNVSSSPSRHLQVSLSTHYRTRTMNMLARNQLGAEHRLHPLGHHSRTYRTLHQLTLHRRPSRGTALPPTRSRPSRGSSVVRFQSRRAKRRRIQGARTGRISLIRHLLCSDQY